MGAGIFGFEVDFGYAPNFFESTEGDGDFDYGDSNVTTLMGNVVLGIPIGGQTRPGDPSLPVGRRRPHQAATSTTPTTSSTSRPTATTLA